MGVQEGINKGGQSNPPSFLTFIEAMEVTKINYYNLVTI